MRSSTVLLIAVLATGCKFDVFEDLDDESYVPKEKPDARAQEVLREWSHRTSKFTTLYAEFERTSFDKAFGSTEINDSSLRYRLPNEARLDFGPDAQGHGAESVVLTGLKELRHYQVMHGTVNGPEPDVRVTVRKSEKPLAESLWTWDWMPKHLLWLLPVPVDVMNRHFNVSVLRETNEEVILRCKWNVRRTGTREVGTPNAMEIALSKSTWLPTRMVRDFKSEKVTYKFKLICPNVKLGERVFDPRGPKTGKWKVLDTTFANKWGIWAEHPPFWMPLPEDKAKQKSPK